MKNLTRNNIFWIVVLVIAVALFVLPGQFQYGEPSIDYSEFQGKVAENQVRNVVITGQTITGEYVNETEFTTTGPLDHTVVGNMLVVDRVDLY